MTTRSYNQYCGLAYALDIVGERWTLLIIRELNAGPRRFTDLMEGLPGISTLLDPIEYQAATWHTNLDTYERIIESDAQVSAIVVAATVYDLAMRDERLPRFSKDEMPKRPAQSTPRPEMPPQPTTAR